MTQRDEQRRYKHEPPDIRGNVGRGRDDDPGAEDMNSEPPAEGRPRHQSRADQDAAKAPATPSTTPAADDERTPDEPHAQAEQQIDEARLRHEPGIGP